MKKLLLILLILVLAVLGALAGTSYWFGLQAESAYREMLEQAARDGRLATSDVRYERGWFESTASATIAPAVLPLSLQITSTIHHGPFPMADGFPPDWSPLTAVIDNRIALASVSGLPALASRTRVDLDGQSETRFDFPAYKLKRDGGTIEWQAVQGEISGSGAARRLKTSFQTPSVRIESRDGSATLGKLALRAERRPAPSGLSLLDFSLDADKLAAQRAAGPVSLEGVRLALSSEEKDNNLSLMLNFDFRQLQDGPKIWGPAQLGLRLARLDSAVLHRYQLQMMSGKPGAAGGQPGAALGKGLETLAALAKKAPELELSRLSLKTPEGEITGRGKLTLDATGLDVAENPLLLLSALGGEGQISIPAGVVRALAERDIRHKLEEHKARGDLSAQEIERLTPEKLADITRQALPGATRELAGKLHLVEDGERYTASASLRQGRLLVNGQPLDKPLRLPAP